jgi:hypothetical protein
MRRVNEVVVGVIAAVGVLAGLALTVPAQSVTAFVATGPPPRGLSAGGPADGREVSSPAGG